MKLINFFFGLVTVLIFFDINGVLIGSPFSFERSGRQFITGVLFSVGFPLLLT